MVYALLSQFQPPHFNKILCDFRHSLFAFVNGEVWPVNQFFVDLNAGVSDHYLVTHSPAHLFQGFGVVIRQFYFLPHASRCVRSFDGFDVQVHDSCTTGQ